MSKVFKSILSVSAAIVLTTAAITPAIVSAWGNDGARRRTYKISEINKGNLGNDIVFNSIEDADAVKQDAGIIMPLKDERNFVGARDKSTGNHGKNNEWDGNSITVEEGKTYIVRLYVHNNNPNGEAATAENVKVSFQIPEMISASPRLNGYIDAPGTKYSSYWDYVDFKSADGRAFYLDYVEGSALVENNHYGAGGGKTVSDKIATNAGVKVSYKANEDGKVPGCYGFASYYTIEVKPVFESSSVQKEVRMAGTKDEFGESVDAKVGDKVEFRIHYKNLGASLAKDVMIRDSLPNNLKYVEGSAKLKNASNPDGLAYNDPTVAAVNVGNYKAPKPNEEGGDAYLYFTAEVVDNSLECNKTNRLINWAKVSVNGFAMQDSAQVYVAKTCDNPPTPTPTPTPEPTPTPTPEPTPNELPSTGPETIMTGAIGAGSVVTALGCYLASRKKLM